MHTPHRHVVLRKIASALVVTLSMLATSRTRADDIEAARRDFAEGVRLLQAGEAESARRLFERADAAHHAPSIVYNLAVAEEHLTHPQAAVDAYERYLAEVGDTGELSAAAQAAIAQIKARSTRLRVETTPPGARIFVDGFELATRAPVLFLVPAGRHLVTAQGDGWRGEAPIEASGSGDTFAVALLPSKTEPAASAPNVTSATSPPPDRRIEPHARAGPAGFVWGAAFALMPYHLFGTAAGANQRDATQVMAGTTIELGGAVTDRFALVARGLFAAGAEAKPSEGPPISYALMGGPGASVRLGSSLWLGGTFLAGRLETVAHDAFYGTDFVLGVMGEAAVVVIASASGQYLLGAQPGALLASKNDNTAFFLPVTFGYRAY